MHTLQSADHKGKKMAQDTKSIGNSDMFVTDELNDIQEALKIYAKTMQRKANTEGNPQIRQIYQKTVARAQLTLGTVERIITGAQK